MKPATQARRALLVSLLAGSTVLSAGCTSGGFPLSRMNPFAKSTPAASSTDGTSTVRESIAATTTGAGNQVKAVAVGTKNMMGRTANAMTGVFRKKTDETVASLDADDPLRLDNKPDKVDPEVFVANGQLWESTGDLGKAMESYTKALESSPTHGPALTKMARLHFQQGNYPKAAETFQLAIAQSPQDAGLFNDLGLTLSKMGNHNGASAALERALQLAPGTSRYANNLASVKFEAGDSAGALQILAKNNKPAVAHFNMAYLHYKGGQIPQARVQLSEAMKFESQAGSDAAVGRAIDRSREMLAQIDAGTNPISQAGQYASAAGNKPVIQQTGQTAASAATNPGVSTVSSMGPAMASITPPSSSVATPAAMATPAAKATPAATGQPSTTAAPSWMQAANPNWLQGVPTTTSSTPGPASTTTTAPAASVPTTTAKPSSSSGYTMPQ